MKEFEVMASGKQYIAVEVPDGLANIEILEPMNSVLLAGKLNGKYWESKRLPAGNYTIIGKVLNLTDEQMAGITGVSASKAMIAMEFLIQREGLSNNDLILERK